MKQFKVSYEDNDGDLSHVWVYAYDKDGAKVQARQEYWDIMSIVQIIEIN